MPSLTHPTESSLHTFVSATSSATPVATLTITSLSVVDSKISTWSLVVAPPRGILGTGRCRSCTHAVRPGHQQRRRGAATHLDRRHVEPRGIPPRACPPLDAHRAHAQQTDRPVAITHIHSIRDLRRYEVRRGNRQHAHATRAIPWVSLASVYSASIQLVPKRTSRSSDSSVPVSTHDVFGCGPCAYLSVQQCGCRVSTVCTRASP